MKTQILYHFTSDNHIGSVLKEGITLGVIPRIATNGDILFATEYQWLTRNPTYNQSWQIESRLSYDRSANRLTVNIPPGKSNKLIKWTDYCALYPNILQRTLNSYGDPENWFVYKGVIKPHWIKKVEHK